jgi:N-acyl amino acid synthase of PEP-CTERM/exosortase system
MSFYGEAAGVAAMPLPLGTLSSRDLGREFRQYFGIVLARSDALRDEAYAIRHAVYCDELRHAPSRPDGRETDEFDVRSEHLLLGSVQQSRYVGCARLVLTGLVSASEPLPLEDICGATIGARWSNLKRTRRIAELSRLAVVADFRRRKGEQARDLAIGDADFGTPGRPRFPFIPVGLGLASIALAKRLGIDTLVVLAEPHIATHFGRLGLAMQQIGGPVQHHGTRVPYTMDVEPIVRSLRSFMRPLYEAVAQDVEAG